MPALRDDGFQPGAAVILLPGEVRGDAEFTAFQAKLATVVANARATGIKISTEWKLGCRCPLGAHPEAVTEFPPSGIAQRGGWSEVSVEHLSQFIVGFSGAKVAMNLAKTFDLESPYVKLGEAYRRRFS